MNSLSLEIWLRRLLSRATRIADAIDANRGNKTVGDCREFERIMAVVESGDPGLVLQAGMLLAQGIGESDSAPLPCKADWNREQIQQRQLDREYAIERLANIAEQKAYAQAAQAAQTTTAPQRQPSRFVPVRAARQQPKAPVRRRRTHIAPRDERFHADIGTPDVLVPALSATQWQSVLDWNEPSDDFRSDLGPNLNGRPMAHCKRH